LQWAAITLVCSAESRSTTLVIEPACSTQIELSVQANCYLSSFLHPFRVLKFETPNQLHFRLSLQTTTFIELPVIFVAVYSACNIPPNIRAAKTDSG